MSHSYLRILGEIYFSHEGEEPSEKAFSPELRTIL